MQRFLSFLAEASTGFIPGRGSIKSSGADMARHVKQYITPHIGSKTPTHVVSHAHDNIEAGSNVSIHKTENIGGVLHAHVKHEGSGKALTIPVHKLHKPGEVKNKGLDFETKFHTHLQAHGLVPKNAKPAGSASGKDVHDVTIVGKKKAHTGQVSSKQSVFHGEVKGGLKGAFGQVTIHHDPEKGGWHIPEHIKQKSPKLAAHIEKAGVLQHMNKVQNPQKGVEKTASGRAKTIEIPHKNLHPALSYLKDKGSHFLHVEGHGTYRGGDKTDVTKHGLPQISGEGKFRVREKNMSAAGKHVRTVQFLATKLNKSHVNLENPEHAKEFKKRINSD